MSIWSFQYFPHSSILVFIVHCVPHALLKSSSQRVQCTVPFCFHSSGCHIAARQAFWREVYSGDLPPPQLVFPSWCSIALEGFLTYCFDCACLFSSFMWYYSSTCDAHLEHNLYCKHRILYLYINTVAGFDDFFYHIKLEGHKLNIL